MRNLNKRHHDYITPNNSNPTPVKPVLALLALIATSITGLAPANSQETPDTTNLHASFELNNSATLPKNCEKNQHRVGVGFTYGNVEATSDQGTSQVPYTSFGFRYDFSPATKDNEMQVYIGPEVNLTTSQGKKVIDTGLNLTLKPTENFRLHTGIDLRFTSGENNPELGPIEGGVTIFPTDGFGLDLTFTHGLDAGSLLATTIHQDYFEQEPQDTTSPNNLNAGIFVYPTEHFGLHFEGGISLEKDPQNQHLGGGLIFSF